MVRVRIFTLETAANCEHPRGVELRVECSGLTCIHHDQQLPVSFFLIHLSKSVSQIIALYIFSILEFQKLITSMTCHVKQNVAFLISEKPLRSWHRSIMSTRQQAQKILYRHFVASVIHLHVVTVEVESMIFIVENLSRVFISGIAGHIIGEHQNDMVIRYP
ncbi:hypothetical protein Mapa_016458 [Marchantia paleacea]|nr:hypothetical protein Mapa_016458 [Marchantia paleacea]